MPDSLTSFEHREDGFKFGLKGCQVALKIAELEKIKSGLKSASSSLDFSLTGNINPINENQTEVQLLLMEILILLSK